MLLTTTRPPVDENPRARETDRADPPATSGGCEMDAQVAARVFGCLRVIYVAADGRVFGAPPELIASGDIPAEHGRVGLPNYSRSLEHAWAIFGAMATRHARAAEYIDTLVSLLGDGTTGGDTLTRLLARPAEQAATLLCRAALATLGEVS